MKKILIISGVFPPEQVTSALMNYDLAFALSKDYDVTVLRPYPSRPMGMKFDYDDMNEVPFKTILIDSYVHPTSQLLGRFKESFDFGRKCVKYIKKHHKEIDFIYNNPWQLFGVGLIAKSAKKYGIPYMIAIQDIYPECLFTNKKFPSIIERLGTNILIWIDKYYQKNASCIRTISNEMRDYLSLTRKISKEKYLVVNNWQNDEDFLFDYPVSKSEKLNFAYVGSINAHANVDLIIRAFNKAAIPNSELKIYGGGNKKEYCQQLVTELGSKSVSFDYVSRDQIPIVQSQVDALILALPSGNGNLCLPSKMTSYMLSGKPVIASVDNVSATTRYINEAKCGISVEPDNIDKLAEGLREFVFFDKDKRQIMGINSKIYANKYLTKSINLKIVCEKIKNIID